MTQRIAYVVAPDGANGGGMGRVKDYIVQAPPGTWGDITPLPLITRDGGGRLHSLRLLWRALGMIRAAHRAGTLALVHVNMGDRLSILRKALVVWQCHALGIPVFLHLHAVELVKLSPWTMRLLVAPVFRRATAAILLGDVYRTWMNRTLGVTTTPGEILWNGVPIAPVPGRDHLGPRTGPLHILFLGSLGERKGVADLIAALASLQGDANWHATIAGPGDIERYRDMARSAGIGDRVAFPGWQEQDQARTLLANADMLVLPSYDEGLPLVILEALALGTPVIATPVGAIPEVLEHKRDILLTAPGARAELAQRIASLLDDAPLRQQLCDGGLETFRRMFTMQAFSQSLLAIWLRYCRLP